MTPNLLHRLALAAAMAFALPALAQTTTKDVVVERLAVPAEAASAPAAGDAMALSVLLESPDGTLRAQGADAVLHTGDRLRIRLAASRGGRVMLFNTNPRGQTRTVPIWQGAVAAGQETVSPRLALVGSTGIEQLHVVLVPEREAAPLAWFGRWQRAGAAGATKDIQLDVQDTPTATYLLNPAGQGLVATLRIAHAAR